MINRYYPRLLIALVTLTGLSARAQSVTHFPQVVVIGPNANTITVPTAGSNYNLLVEGGILTEHLRVANRTGQYWADYVFAPGYRLLSLSEVKRYITLHGHLPDMPSAATVNTEGIDVVQTQRLLLQKIEELTLHAIRQEAAITRLQRQLRHRVRSAHRQ
ncbi:hypothetical protein [Spirosoma pollinicola]|uniref:Uncharacterized protein n=1 Tax=Spirosoma pollinicola TaxID=2057025 RepID=A0A2K8YYH1_9BACT|nr:hypothetical protein [Spirosoma pollinicola]AUD02683.1 hypothetical protein CWM47_13055 [Spirosoma pollinicola]